MRWMAGPVRFMKSLQERHGDVFTIHLLQEAPWVIVSDPALVKQVFTASTETLYAGQQKRILEPVLGSSSVLLTDGEQHMRLRKLLMPMFHSSRLDDYQETMRMVAEAEIERWPAGVAAPAASRMNAIALEVILRTVLGLAEKEGEAPLRTSLEQLMEFLATPRGLVALGESSRLRDERFAEFHELLARVDKLIFAEISSRRKVDLRGRPDVLSLLLEARYEDGSLLSDRELRDELMTLVVAGHETTATSLAWALERLVRNPEALARTVAEARDGGGPYTEAVVRETLRIRPAFLVVPRLVRKPFQLGEYLIPPGVAVTPSIPLVHRRPDVYPDPEAFRPERFLERQPGTYTWIPFGGGVRRCIGAGFSLLEMRIVLSTLLARATVRMADAEPEPAIRRMLVMAPSRGARLVLEPR